MERNQTISGYFAEKGKETTVRKQMGDEIQAACGQLKRRYLNSVT